MKKSIKKRIEAVRRGEVPEGYVFQNHQLRPVDWEYEKIGKYLVPYDEFSNDTEAYPLATSSRQGLMLQSEYYNNQRYEETSGGFHVVPEGYVTYRHMSDDDIFRFNVNRMGNSVLVSPEYPVFTTSDGLHQDMLVSYLNNMKEFKAYCSAQKKGSSRTRMYFSRLGEFAMPIPPVKEQQKIAEILATCDRMIELTQQLLEEKRRQKQWLMRTLLNPESGVRLPGFEEEWSTGSFSGVCTFINGRAYKQDELLEKGKYPVLRVGNLFTKSDWYYSDMELPAHMYIDNGDLIYAWSASFGPQIWAGEKVIFHYHIWKVLPNNVVCKEYLYQYFLYDVDQLSREQQGGTMAHITKESMEKRVCKYPTIAEQQRIAEILDTADQDVLLAENNLEFWQQRKKALMQLLLTLTERSL